MEGPTGFTIAVVRPDGERAFLAHLGHQSSYSVNRKERRLVNEIKSGDMVHFSGYFMQPKLRLQALRMMKAVRGRGAKVSFDPGWDPEGFKPATRSEIMNLLEQVDFFEPNLSELQAIAGLKSIRKAVRRVSRCFEGILALKKGIAGSQVFVGSKPVANAEAFRVKSLGDSTGAGDAFDGGFLHGVVRGKSLMESARFGNAVAALLVSSHGYGALRFPLQRQVRRLIRV